MHPTISYCLAQARVADLRRQAQRAASARAVRRAGSAHPGDTAAGAAAVSGQHADLVIRPRPKGVGLLEFDQLDA